MRKTLAGVVYEKDAQCIDWLQTLRKNSIDVYKKLIVVYI